MAEGGGVVAYLNLLASVPEPEVERLRHDPSYVVAPSLVLGVSHMIGYWVQVQPLGGLLGRALDGGQLLHSVLWHPFRSPCYHRPPIVADLSRDIGDAWNAAIAGQPPEDHEWLSFEVDRLLRVFRHATGTGECVVSALEAPVDEERASKVRLPWSSAAPPNLAMQQTRPDSKIFGVFKRLVGPLERAADFTMDVDEDARDQR